MESQLRAIMMHPDGSKKIGKEFFPISGKMPMGLGSIYFKEDTGS